MTSDPTSTSNLEGPVYWCSSCKKELAEIEIEHCETSSPSIHVKFDLTRESLAAFAELAQIHQREGATRASIILWTTTPWALAANREIALHPGSDYVAIKVPTLDGTEIHIIARGLQETYEKILGFEKSSQPLLVFKAERLYRQKTKHPLNDGQSSLIVLSEHVTLEEGTGAEHGVSGHEESKADEAIIRLLEDDGYLVKRTDIRRNFPHCRRCHAQVISRARRIPW